ncbi:MAG: hypothetical protein DMG52_32210 [Acidobacteria bacterium]|nr:MAG: hypothetical protein DMG52_32210 [Acidobacteriota bacterium]
MRQQIMGHKTIAMTVRYAHLASQYQLAAVQRLIGFVETKPSLPTDTRTSSRGEEGDQAGAVNAQ